MNTHEQHAADIAAPVAKTVTMWATIAAGIGINTWAEAASFASFCAAAIGSLYSFLLVTEWVWKKVVRPISVEVGLLQPRKADDDEE